MFNQLKLAQSRPCSPKHHIAKYLNNKSIIYILYNLTEVRAHVLESYFIKYSNKPLTKINQD